MIPWINRLVNRKIGFLRKKWQCRKGAFTAHLTTNVNPKVGRGCVKAPAFVESATQKGGDLPPPCDTYLYSQNRTAAKYILAVIKYNRLTGCHRALRLLKTASYFIFFRPLDRTPRAFVIIPDLRKHTQRFF